MAGEKDYKMKSVSMFTLGVEDLARSIRFYEALGCVLSPESDPKMCTFLITGNIVIGLVPYDFLAKDALLPLSEKRAYNGFTLAINGASAEEVDAVYEKALAAGAVPHQQPQWKDWGGYPGYSGYFLDPDGYPWEVAYAPFLRLDENNRLLCKAPGET
jgi:predicted lactoylglutathione lyase